LYPTRKDRQLDRPVLLNAQVKRNENSYPMVPSGSWASLGYIACNRGDYDKAEILYNQSLNIRTELGNRTGTIERT
jgi:hypothetical protein